jgi:hypothetical protein
VRIISAIEWLANNDDKPHDGIISKLVERSKVSRPVVANFIKLMRLRSFEFTDSPLNKNFSELKIDKRKSNVNIESDDD